MGLKDRLRKLENRPEAKECSECRLPPGDPGYIVIWDKESSREKERNRVQEWCSTCGEPKYLIIEVAYDDEGEAAEPGDMSWP